VRRIKQATESGKIGKPVLAILTVLELDVNKPILWYTILT